MNKKSTNAQDIFQRVGLVLLLGICAMLPIVVAHAQSQSPQPTAMRIGSRGENVRGLQQRLVELGYLSSDNATGYFGTLTRAAVQKFQCDKMNICSGSEDTTGYGNAGPRTGQAIASALSSGTTRTSANTISSNASQSSIQATINALLEQVRILQAKIAALTNTAGNTTVSGAAASGSVGSSGTTSSTPATTPSTPSVSGSTSATQPSSSQTTTPAAAQTTSSQPTTSERFSLTALSSTERAFHNWWGPATGSWFNTNRSHKTLLQVGGSNTASSDSISNGSNSGFTFRMDPAPWREAAASGLMFFSNGLCAVPASTGLHLAEDDLSWRLFGEDAATSAKFGSVTRCYELFPTPENVPLANTSLHPWAMATRAIWSGHVVGTTLYTLTMSENKSAYVSDGTIRRGPAGRNQSGYVNFKLYSDDPVSPATVIPMDTTDGYYMAFTTLGKGGIQGALPATQQDLGPIVWPRYGYIYWSSYLENQGKCSKVANNCWQSRSQGVSNPHGFLNTQDGYLYVFYAQMSNGWADGQGIYVARAKATPDMTANDFMCGANFDKKCLPDGFDKNNLEKSLALEGPNVQPIIALNGSISFSVAKIKGQNRFVGVFERWHQDTNTYTTSLYISAPGSMTQWSAPIDVPQLTYTGDFYKDGLINYPTLMSLEGNNDEIDPAAFYIIGATSNATFSPDNLTCTDWPCNATKLKVRLAIE